MEDNFLIMNLKEKYFKILTLADNALALPFGRNKDEFAYMEWIYYCSFFALLDLDVEQEDADGFLIIKNDDRVFSLDKDNIDMLKTNGFDQILKTNTISSDYDRNIDNEYEDENPLNKHDLSDTDINYTERRVDREENPDLYNEENIEKIIDKDNLDDEEDDFELHDFEEDLDDQVIERTEIRDADEDYSNQQKDTDTDDDVDDDDFLEIEEENQLEFVDEPEFESNDLEFVDEPDFSNFEEDPIEFADSDINVEMDDSIDGYLDDNKSEDYSVGDREEVEDKTLQKTVNEEIGPIMPYSMHQNDFTYSAVRVSISEFGQTTDVKLLVTPLRIDVDTPDILVDAITRNGTTVYISDNDKKVVANIDGYDIIISGYMDDTGIFNVSVYVDGVDEDSVQIKTTYNDGGLKGHTMAYDDANNVVIHVVPIGKSNNSSGFADFVYYINNDGKKIYGDTSDNSNNISFDVNGDEYNLRATWDREDNFILSLT